MNSILLFDFDGTIALGDGPVLAYAQHVASVLAEGDDFVDRIRAALNGADEEALDGYDAVRRAAERRGASIEQLSAAYLASRAQLATDAAPISAPEGLAAFLENADALRILVTNAPAIRMEEALEVLGLSGLFDRIIAGAGKPAGLKLVLEDLPADARVLSIGDIWHNDLAPAHAAGHATALVGAFPAPDATPTYCAAEFSTLIPQLENWLRASDHTLPHAELTHTEG